MPASDERRAIECGEICARPRGQRENLAIRHVGRWKLEFRCVESDRESAALPTPTIRETRD